MLTGGGAPIEFRDEHGARWTVTVWPIKGTDQVRLQFLSENGERRAVEVLRLDDDAWAHVNEVSWQSLLRSAQST